MNQAALDSLLRQSRAAKQRLTVTSPGGDPGRADPAGLQVFLRRGHLPLVPRQRVTSGPLCAPPTRRRRLREPEDARALEARGKRCASPTDAPGELTLGGRPPSSPAARRRSQGRQEGAGAPASAARSSPAHGSCRGRARAAAEADLPCPASRPAAAAAAANSASSRLPATRTRQRRPPHEVARTGTDGGTPQTDPEAFPPQALSRLEGGGRNPGSYFPAPGAAGWQAEA